MTPNKPSFAYFPRSAQVARPEERILHQEIECAQFASREKACFHALPTGSPKHPDAKTKKHQAPRVFAIKDMRLRSKNRHSIPARRDHTSFLTLALTLLLAGIAPAAEMRTWSSSS